MLTRRRALWLGAGFIAGCAAPPASPLDALTPLYANPAKDQWPDEFARLSPDVQDAYRYAVTHREVLQYIPCFCGCVATGHRSNFDCYVRQVMPDGRIQLDTMSFG